MIIYRRNHYFRDLNMYVKKDICFDTWSVIPILWQKADVGGAPY